MSNMFEESLGDSRRFRRVINGKGTRVSIEESGESFDAVPEKIPTYKFVSGKGLYLVVKHNSVVYHLKMNTGTI